VADCAARPPHTLNPKPAIADATARITRERIPQPLLYSARVRGLGPPLQQCCDKATYFGLVYLPRSAPVNSSRRQRNALKWRGGAHILTSCQIVTLEVNPIAVLSPNERDRDRAGLRGQGDGVKTVSQCALGRRRRAHCHRHSANDPSFLDDIPQHLREHRLEAGKVANDISRWPVQRDPRPGRAVQA
jgi:hypothetical protein